MADFTDTEIEAVVETLEKFAQESNQRLLANLAKVAVFQDSLKKKTAAEAAPANAQLYESLATANALDRSGGR